MPTLIEGSIFTVYRRLEVLISAILSTVENYLRQLRGDVLACGNECVGISGQSEDG